MEIIIRDFNLSASPDPWPMQTIGVTQIMTLSYSSARAAAAPFDDSVCELRAAKSTFSDHLSHKRFLLLSQ